MSAAAPDIAAVVAGIDIWRGLTPVPERINGGITNINWRIRIRETGASYFLKIHGAGTELFIDRDVAHEAALKVSDTGYAPKLLHYDPVQGIEVYEFLEGFRSCGVMDIQDPVIRDAVLGAYKAVHTTTQLGRTQTGFDQLDGHLERLRKLGAALPPDFEQLMWQRGRAEAAVRASGFDTCACYNDGYVSNYMVDASKRVKIIDWEYAANNDPYWDLAMMSFESFLLDAATRREMLEVYDGSYRRDVAARIHLYVGLAAMTWGCWATLQEQVSKLPFDFGKYADLLFLRARHSMLAPTWEEALAAV